MPTSGEPGANTGLPKSHLCQSLQRTQQPGLYWKPPPGASQLTSNRIGMLFAPPFTAMEIQDRVLTEFHHAPEQKARLKCQG